MLGAMSFLALHLIAVSIGATPDRLDSGSAAAHPLVGRWCHVVWDGGRPESGTLLTIDDDWLVLRADQEIDQPELWIPRARVKGIAAFATHPDQVKRASIERQISPPRDRLKRAAMVSLAGQGF